jgi:hypothetical protein
MNWLARGLVVALMSFATASAQEVVKHRENVKVGPYSLEVQFSEFPVRAERSLDFLFVPTGGIADKIGAVKMTSAGSKRVIESNLVRFTKNRNIWGFDLLSIPEKGTWNLEFKIKGNQGTGFGNLKLEVLERPAGPSVALTQPLGLIPILAVFVLAARAWIRVRPLRHTEANRW